MAFPWSAKPTITRARRTRSIAIARSVGASNASSTRGREPRSVRTRRDGAMPLAHYPKSANTACPVTSPRSSEEPGAAQNAPSASGT